MENQSHHLILGLQMLYGVQQRHSRKRRDPAPLRLLIVELTTKSGAKELTGESTTHFIITGNKIIDTSCLFLRFSRVNFSLLL